uniref:Cyclin N-terminal domain-containing protein n=1 Tax=Anopheles atroparvus TaxID=41427 RepID=A0AAG5DBQ6_ANOAO
MDHHNGPNRASRVPSSEPSQPQRRGRKRKLKSDGLVEAENVQPSAKRRPNRRTPHDDALASAAPSVPASSSATPGVGLSMPSIPSSGGSSLDGQSLPAAAHSDCTSDTQSSSECFSNAVEYDLYQLVSPASVGSNVLSPVDALGIPDDSASHQLHPHHLQHHQRHPNHQSSWLPNDTIPHGNRKVDPLVEKPSNANVATVSAAAELVESCYWAYKQRFCPMPSLSWVDSAAMWKQMCRKDDVGWLAREPKMFNDHPGLQPRMRAILLDWLNEVCEVYKMYRETYYLAVDYIDRYLSRKKGLQKTHLQLLGVTALFIAAKVEEIYPPKLRDFAYVTDGACTEEDILREELLLLCELDWNINPLTVIGWLGMYMQINVTTREPEGRQRQVRVAKLPAKSSTDENVDIKSATSTTTTTTITMIQSNNSITVEKPAEKASAGGATTKTDDAFVYPQFSAMEYAHTAQLIDLCSLDVGMANFKYSVIAAAAISHTFDGKTATLVSGLHWEDIAPCAKWMEPFFQVICEENASYPLTFPEQNEQIKTSHGLQLISPNLLTDLYYNKQTHTTSLAMLDVVATKIEQMESTARMVQLEASPASLGNIESESGILTPPASTRKSLEMVLIAAGGGGGSCQTQQHPPQHHQLQPQHHQLQPQEVTQLQPPPGHGVIVKEIALK